jgi:hypothetical protein
MRESTRSSIPVVAAGVAVGLLLWAAWRLAGVDLTVRSGGQASQVGAVSVLVTTVVAGLAARAVYALMARRPRTLRWWPFVGTTAMCVSMIGPSYLADGVAAVALSSMHFAVGIVLTFGFIRFVPLYRPVGVEHDS